MVDTIYADIKKAFDSVDHRILIRKLNNIGLCGSILSWLSSYLSDLTQIVKISNT